jgi:hypothetical protein
LCENKKYGLCPPKIAESGTQSLGHGLCWSGGLTPLTIMTPAKVHFLLAFTMIDQEIKLRLVQTGKKTNSLLFAKAQYCSMLRGQSQFMIYFRLYLELDLVCQTGI